MKKTVGILIFNDVEVLDFAGPFEVFSVTSELNNYELFEVYTIAKKTEPVTARNDFSVNPKYNFENAPKIDILIIAGGAGTRVQMKDVKTLNWIKKVHKNTMITASICSGSRLLGTLGLLNNQIYCTHQGVYDHMLEIVPSGFPQKTKRFVGFDKIYTSGGISAGIDLSFHIVANLHGRDIALKTANYMEYDLNSINL